MSGSSAGSSPTNRKPRGAPDLERSGRAGPVSGNAAGGPSEIHRVAPYGANQRVDAYLSRYLTQHSRSEWQRLIETGIVTLNGALSRPSARLSEGDRIEIRPVATFSMLTPDPSIILEVVYEDSSIVIINKPAGLVVHPAPGHQTGTLVHALLARFPELQDPTGSQRPGIIHRLDKDTSGLMVVGKTVEAITVVQEAMQKSEVVKRYRLLLLGNIEEDQAVIDVPIGRDPANRQRMAAHANGRTAKTEFTVLDRLDGYTYVEATLSSGRTHQLRVHFAYIHHPVAGDRTYGSGRGPAGLNRQFVHSCELILVSPATKEHLRLTSVLPDDLDIVLQNLRNEERPAETDLAPQLYSAPSEEYAPTLSQSSDVN